MMNHYVMMFGIMILSGFLSTMNVWVDKVSDMNLSLNDLYMVLLMSGWMLFFMAVLNGDKTVILIGLTLALSMIWCIRTQFLVTEEQYLRGMIPHHSMAVLMSKALQKKNNKIQSLLQNIIKSQESEISYMKQLL